MSSTRKDEPLGPLFESAMARKTDPDTSRQAARAVEPGLGRIQRLVMEAFEREGPMTARAAERLPDFESYGFSTIRKRISELAQGGYLEAVGTEGRPPATVYRIVDTSGARR